VLLESARPPVLLLESAAQRVSEQASGRLRVLVREQPREQVWAA
jgi:hypothetical protein